MIVLIDNGHGKETPGKRSPDSRLREWAWTREIAQALTDRLRFEGITAERIVPEDTDISLKERCRRVNAIARTTPAILVSIHVNAAVSINKWCTARGWCVFVSPNASGESKRLAQTLYKSALNQNLQGNRAIPGCQYWVQNLAMCRDTICPAVLTENLFMDNREDCNFLLSPEGKKHIVDLHVEGIKRYIQSL